LGERKIPRQLIKTLTYIINKEEAAYNTLYQGHFSRKLASWAISNMEMEDAATKTMKPVAVRSVDEYYDIPFGSEDGAWLTGYVMRKAVQLLGEPCL